EATAEAAADEARRRAKDLSIDQDAIAVIVRDSEGEFHVHTSHHSVEDGTTWGMLWGARVLDLSEHGHDRVGGGLVLLTRGRLADGPERLQRHLDELRGDVAAGLGGHFSSLIVHQIVTSTTGVRRPTKYGSPFWGRLYRAQVTDLTSPAMPPS